MNKPLSGIKVLELATFVAAPVTARLLGDLGATVIKVERPEGDDWRNNGINWHPDRYSQDENPVFDIYNSGKKHISLNLKTPEGIEVFHKLLAQTDIFVTNVRPVALGRLGLTYEQLKDRYPSLIYAIVLGYGEKGPDAAKPAFDTTAFWSKSGFTRDLSPLNEHYAPVTCPSGVGDTVTGMLLMGEICAALYRRSQTGLGDFVRSTLYHNGIFAMGTMGIITQRPYGRNYPLPRAHKSPSADGYYQTGDNDWVFFASSGLEKNYTGLHKILDFPDDFDRRTATPTYYEVLRDAFLRKTCPELLKLAEEADIPLVRINHFQDPGEDEQAWANGFVEHVTAASGRSNIMPSSPIEMDSVGPLKTIPAPRAGHDTTAVLKELGYTDEAIAAMYANGAASAEK